MNTLKSVEKKQKIDDHIACVDVISDVLILQLSVSSLCAEQTVMHTLCCHNCVCLSGSLESKFLFSLSGSLDAMFEKSLNTSVNVTSPKIK